MELVEGQPGLRELRFHARDKGRRHIAADLLDGLGTSAMVEQIGLEPLEGRGILAFGDEDRPGLLQIDKEADVVVPPLAGRFIHPELPQIGGIGLLAGPVDVMFQHAPQTGVMLPDQLGDPLDRHGLGQDHDEGLKQQGEAAARTRPGQGHLQHPASGTPDPRHPGHEMGLVLEKVQMPPALWLRVVNRTVPLPAGGTGKTAPPGEVQSDVQTSLPGIELTTHHRPRWGQP